MKRRWGCIDSEVERDGRWQAFWNLVFTSMSMYMIAYVESLSKVMSAGSPPQTSGEETIWVAPDYPGFGHSDWPDPKRFACVGMLYRSRLQCHHRTTLLKT
jgi:hypothetical protein